MSGDEAEDESEVVAVEYGVPRTYVGDAPGWRDGVVAGARVAGDADGSEPEGREPTGKTMLSRLWKSRLSGSRFMPGLCCWYPNECSGRMVMAGLIYRAMEE